RVEVAIDEAFHELEPEEHGYFSGSVPARVGTNYRFRLNGEGDLYPDPASRFQPEGPHGPSCVVDPAQFKWTDDQRKGTTLPELGLRSRLTRLFTSSSPKSMDIFPAAYPRELARTTGSD